MTQHSLMAEIKWWAKTIGFGLIVLAIVVVGFWQTTRTNAQPSQGLTPSQMARCEHVASACNP